MDLEALRAEYISQHKANGTFSDSDLEDDCMHIDVVGGTESDDDADDALSAFQSPRSSSDLANNNYGTSDGSNGIGSPTPQLVNPFAGGGARAAAPAAGLLLHNGQQEDGAEVAEISNSRFLALQTHLSHVVTTTASPPSLSSSSSSSSTFSAASTTTLTTATPVTPAVAMAGSLTGAGGGGGGGGGGGVGRLKLPKPLPDTQTGPPPQQPTLTSPISIRRSNPFSIESLLFNHT